MSASGKGGRLLYADVLRVLSIFAVVVLHVSAGWMDRVAVTTSAWNTFNFYGGLVRWCVPLFVMLSGMFLLDPERRFDGRSLLRHAGRILLALFAWSILYAAAGEVLAPGPFSLTGLTAGLAEAFQGKLHYHLWFLPMILGLYLLTPLLRAFVRGAEERDFRWFFLLVLVFAFLLPTLQKLWPNAVLDEWTRRLDLRLVTGYVGYYVAGYYLRSRTLSPRIRRVLYALGLLGLAATIGGTALLSRAEGKAVLTLCSYFSPTVALTAAAVFVAFRSLPLSGGCPLARLAPITFGIYLCHDLFLMLLKHAGRSPLDFAPVLSVPLFSLGIFLCAALTAWVLSKLPLVGRALT